MYKIGIIGERDSVLGFMSLGFSVYEAAGADDAAKTLHALVKSGEYAVIFVTENFAEKIAGDMARYRDNPLPAIISVPGYTGSTGYGLSEIKSAVERAVGTDIIFKE
jgi:V/A-type H+-transporting ATPase subunit F